MVSLDCAVKQRVPPLRLAAVLRAAARGEAALAAAREASGGEVDPEEIPVEIAGPDGTQRVMLAELLRAGQALAPLAPHCDRCPARATLSAFGCYGAVAYPIEAATEEWLLARLPSDLDTTAGSLLRGAVRDLDYDGAPVAEIRRRGRGVFASPRPAIRRWGGPDPWTLSSDQLWHPILCTGPLAPSHAGMVALFTGVIPHDVHPDEISRALADPAAARRVFGNARIAAPAASSAQVAAVARLLEAMAIAASLGAPLWIDA